MNKFNGFWMVLGSGTPTYRHNTLMSARQEAERLATMNPGSTFYILECKAACVKSQVQWAEAVWDETGDEIPF